MITRLLTREEIPLVWTIDRSEVIHNIYMLQEGELVLKPDYFDVRDWPPGEAETYTPLLYDCFEHGGVFYGVFEDVQLVGVAIIDTKFIGPALDLLQLKFLHVSQAYRKQGLGNLLFQKAKEVARTRGARGLYISATPSENTINFYRRLGCIITPTPDPDLFALEPEDIHLECPV
jgi:predicted N-acetyltransferase YhbS